MKKNLILGVGINDSDVKVSVFTNGKQVHCKAYNRWKALLQRCVSSEFKQSHKTYEECSICREWLFFSQFKKWLCSHDDWENLCLDKDLLIDGNKHYSPDTCVMIPAWLNNFLILPVIKTNGLLPGVHFSKQMNKYQSRVNNRWTGRKEHLGYFVDQQSAHEAWKTRKIEILESRRYLIDERVYQAIIRKLR